MGRCCIPLVTVVGCLVWVPLEGGDSGVRSGGIVQVEESERQTLGSNWCRTSSGGWVLLTTTSIGINLQTWVSTTGELGENSPRTLSEDSFRPWICLSKKGYVALDARIKSIDLGKCGSIYTQEYWKSLARNYDIWASITYLSVI